MNSVFAARRPTLGPDVPRRFSYRLLSAVESCPRRWWLEHATYPQLTGPYPLPTSAPALRGTIVHGALEEFARRLKSAGMPPVGSEEFAAIHAAFDIRLVIRSKRKEVLNRQSTDRGMQIGTSDLPLDDCIDAFKFLLREAYGLEHAEALRDRLTEPAEKPAHALTQGIPAARPGGLAPEAEVEIDDPPLRATIDLVRYGDSGDTLIEFKSGAPREQHRLQADLYSAVWVAATGRRVRVRRILYLNAPPTELDGMDPREAGAVLAALRTRISAAMTDLKADVPPARPNSDNCKHCPVRQLCDEYWTATSTADLRWRPSALQLDNGWRDIELSTTGASWDGAGFSLRVPGDQETKLFCSVPPKYRPPNNKDFRGARLLGVALRSNGPALEVVWSARSEMFWLT